MLWLLPECRPVDTNIWTQVNALPSETLVMSDTVSPTIFTFTGTSTLKLVAAVSSEMLVMLYQITQVPQFKRL
jgi:hypothetical protein